MLDMDIADENEKYGPWEKEQLKCQKHKHIQISTNGGQQENILVPGTIVGLTKFLLEIQKKLSFVVVVDEVDRYT